MVDINIKLGENTFLVKGENLEIDADLIQLFRTWVNAQQQGGVSDAEKIEVLAAQLQGHNAVLRAALHAHTPPVT